jgi:hypothetical protein
MVGNFSSFILIIGVLADVLWGSVVDAQQAFLRLGQQTAVF